MFNREDCIQCCHSIVRDVRGDGSGVALYKINSLPYNNFKWVLIQIAFHQIVRCNCIVRWLKRIKYIKVGDIRFIKQTTKLDWDSCDANFPSVRLLLVRLTFMCHTNDFDIHMCHVGVHKSLPLLTSNNNNLVMCHWEVYKCVYIILYPPLPFPSLHVKTVHRILCRRT